MRLQTVEHVASATETTLVITLVDLTKVESVAMLFSGILDLIGVIDASSSPHEMLSESWNSDCGALWGTVLPLITGFDNIQLALGVKKLLDLRFFSVCVSQRCVAHGVQRGDCGIFVFDCKANAIPC